MHYLIDAYNLLFCLAPSSYPLQKRRQYLIEEIEAKAASLSLPITLVFDATKQEGELSTRSHYGAIEIFYAGAKKTADQEILELVELSSHRSQLCVVTADKDLSRKVKQLHSHTLSLESFIHLIEKKGKKERLPEKNIQDSPREKERLLKIFEKRSPFKD